MTTLTIDPGPRGKEYGWSAFDEDGNFLNAGSTKTDKLHILFQIYQPDVVCVESIKSYGMSVGQTTFDTCFEIGRIIEKSLQFGSRLYLIPRPEIKLILCGKSQAKDKNVTLAIKEMFDPTGGGKDQYVGIKANKGPLYGISGHMWSAMAVGYAYLRCEIERGVDCEVWRY